MQAAHNGTRRPLKGSTCAKNQRTSMDISYENLRRPRKIMVAERTGPTKKVDLLPVEEERLVDLGLDPLKLKAVNES